MGPGGRGEGDNLSHLSIDLTLALLIRDEECGWVGNRLFWGWVPGFAPLHPGGENPVGN